MNDVSRFMLNNSLAATSALIKDEKIYAADGTECNVRVFDLCGNYSHTVCTRRAYQRLRFNESDNTFSALGCDCSGRVYCIDENFNELGYTVINTACKRCSDFGAMTDISAVNMGNERFYTVAFEKAAHLFDSDGNMLRTLCCADACETINHFISFGDERYAMGTQKGGFTTCTISDNGDVQNAILDRNLSLRMLFSLDGKVYGLFGYSYIYNRISLIYADGRLVLPKANERICNTCGE